MERLLSKNGGRTLWGLSLIGIRVKPYRTAHGNVLPLEHSTSTDFLRDWWERDILAPEGYELVCNIIWDIFSD